VNDEEPKDDVVLFVLFAAFMITLIFFLHDTASLPPTHSRPVSARVQCAIDTRAPDDLPLDYDTVSEDEHYLCNRRKFPYCHALPVPFFRPLDESYFDVWPKFGCVRDLIFDDYPEGTCGPLHGPTYMCAPSPLAPLR
jgi:hypothetical protein